MQMNQEQKKNQPIFESSVSSSRTGACCRVPRHRLHQPQRRWQCPDAGGLSSAAHRNESIGAPAALSRNWSRADLWTHWWFLKSSWSWVLWNGLWQCFPSSTNTQQRKKQTTHSGSSTCLRTSDAPAPGKGKSRIKIHSSHAAVTHHMHSYLQKKKKIDKST